MATKSQIMVSGVLVNALARTDQTFGKIQSVHTNSSIADSLYLNIHLKHVMSGIQRMSESILVAFE